MSIFSKISKAFKKIVPKEVRDVGKTLLAGVPIVGPAVTAIDKIGRVTQTIKGTVAPALQGTILPAPFDPGARQIPVLPGAGVTNMSLLSSMMPSLPAVGRAAGAVVGGAIRVGRRFLNTPGGKWTKKAIRDLGLFAVGGMVFDAAGNLMGSVQRRRMNPLNARALRRSIRRVKAARGICRDVESMLPKKRSAPVCAPRGKRC